LKNQKNDFKKISLYRNQDNMECIICLQDILRDEINETSCCKKVLYHEQCGLKWLDNCFLNPKCPWCNSQLEQVNNCIVRAYEQLKYWTKEINYQQTTYDNYQKIPNDIIDAQEQFTLIYYQESDKNVFRLVFRNEIVFVFWLKQEILGNPKLLFSFEYWKYLLRNQHLGTIRRNKDGEDVAEGYFE